MATVRDLIESLKALNPSMEVGSAEYYIKEIKKYNLGSEEIKKYNLGSFASDSSILALILSDLVSFEVAHSEGWFSESSENSITNFIPFDFAIEIEKSGVTDESPRFSTIEEVADFLCEQWGC